MPASPMSVERRKLNEGLSRDVKELKEMLAQLISDTRATESARAEREKVLAEELAAMKHIVYGNGSPGLKTDVRILKEKMNSVYWLGSVIIIATVGNIIASILTK